ncbi:MAG TPA: glutamate dehydrogenase, partial [Zeimonas sp.]|nr:glutamate dehydrogenase [Zeimonas sp.]
PEATGYGTVYFAQEMLRRAGRAFEGATVSVSGSGNVAQYAIAKALDLGAKVVTASDSGGTVYLPNGFDEETLAELLVLKNERRGRLSEFAEKLKLQYEPGRRPWHVPVDIALPCATQNELDEHDARTLVSNGVFCVAEGANMPSTIEAVDVFHKAGVLYAPGKASNAGGVATSGLEMAQNAQRLGWTHGEVDERLHAIMKAIHESCVRHGRRPDGTINYVDGANVSAFVKVADAMLEQGVV